MTDEARQAEARGESAATVKFRDREFTVPTEFDDMDVEFWEAVEDGKSVSIVRGALGAEQWATVKGMGLKMRDLAELGDQIAVAMGFKSTGNS